jgi:hypothetical protein
MNVFRPALAAFLVVASAGHAARADEAAMLMERWYESLAAADGEALAAIMDENAEVVLNDIGIVQTKGEFLESMTEWGDAIDGGSISHKITGGSLVSGLTLHVCYRFTSGEQLNSEVFSFNRGLVSRSEQTKTADDCSGF